MATDVAEVLAGLPAVVRRGVRLAPGGRRDLLPLGQAVAGLLDAEVEVTTGLPLIATGQLMGRFGIRSVLAGPDGEPRWLPFVDAVICVPSREPAPDAGVPEPGGPARPAPPNAPAPRLLRWSAPAPELGLSENGVARLSNAWQAVATRAGLWVGPSGTDAPLTARPVSVEGPVVEIGRGGDRLDASLWPLLSGLLGRLAPDIRSRTTLHVHALAPDGGRALRGLAAEHALRMISFAAAPAPRPVRRPPAPAGPAAGAHAGAKTPVPAPVPSAPPASTESADAGATAGAEKPVAAPVPSSLPAATESADLDGPPAPFVTEPPETTITSAGGARQVSAPGSPDLTPSPDSPPLVMASSSTPPVAPEPSTAAATAGSGTSVEASASPAPDVPPDPLPPVPAPPLSARPAGLSSAPLAPDCAGSGDGEAGGTAI
ncbi:hypothetical protein G3M53_94740, partial [Streptomyces sp. SID7982]|nr:hypothetical protein [Streptomyces sp. SID7982]